MTTRKNFNPELKSAAVWLLETSVNLAVELARGFGGRRSQLYKLPEQ